MRHHRSLALAAACLAFAVIGLGAWVRLSDAGLGCPDWPGCYGQWLGVPEHAADPVRAWKEMIHRYFAGTLGLCILALCIAAWRRRAGRLLATALVGLVVFQALLGMWTVTLLLKPAVVVAHLLGGMAILAGLARLALGDAPIARHAPAAPSGLRRHAWLAALLVGGQIALGGWVSGNYAALACPDFPTCAGAWVPAMDFGAGFSLHRELGRDAAGAPLPVAALVAMHWSHRLGALAVALVVGGLALRLLRLQAQRRLGAVLLASLALQIGLGIANVLAAWPLPLAVAHNLGAAVLLLATLEAGRRLAAFGSSR